MKTKQKRRIAMLLTLLVSVGGISGRAWAEEPKPASDLPEIHAASAVLMEYETGEVLFASNRDEKLAPASITKIMTMALVLEQIQQGNLEMTDIVTASENAQNMGGTQIYLEAGEQMCVYDLLMSVAVASANDAAVALGEHIAGGSEAAFVTMMNDKAAELGMKNTTFCNPSGLPEEGHLTTAYDVALMSRYLLSLEQSREFVGTNLYPIREGENKYVMRNSNELIRSYEGCIGIKTGYTAEAGYCLSAAATRNDLTLIAVTMGEDSSSVRNQDTAALLDYGFAHYDLFRAEGEPVTVAPIPVELGTQPVVEVELPQMEPLLRVVPKGTKLQIEQSMTVAEKLHAPVLKGQTVGTITLTADGEKLMTYPLTAKETVAQRTFWQSFLLLVRKIVA